MFLTYLQITYKMSDTTYFYEWECDEEHKKQNKCFMCDVVGVRWTWLQNVPYIDRENTRFVCDDCANSTRVGQTMRLCMDLVYERSERNKSSHNVILFPIYIIDMSVRKTRKNRSIKSYVVAIPSYDRPDAIIEKSLKTLSDGGVPKSLVHIFVANKVEEKRYKNAIPKNMYGKIVVGKIGITEQRKFIIQHYPENQAIVSIDDDVEGLYKKISDKE